MSAITMALPNRSDKSELRSIIFACSLGTIFEWYDFFLYASMSAIIARQYFSGVNPTAAFIFALLAFSAGFVIRPFGALFFGRLGDLIGRKYTFLVTIILMGVSTFVVGLLPAYATIGVAAPVLLIGLRLLQGLAIGGEAGGAIVYVAEQAPNGQRGLYTSFIQITPALGLLLSLVIILGLRAMMPESDFVQWGWRIPFLLSALLLIISVWIRLKMRETPAFQKMKEEGKRSTAPLREAFATWSHAKVTLIALFGSVAGSAVVWQTAQLYTMFFLTRTLGVDAMSANLLIGAMLLVSAPLFVLFGWLSDKIGRRPVIMTGCVLAVLTYFPLFGALARFSNPDLVAAQAAAPIVVVADPSECSFQFNPVGTAQFTSSCDIAKSFLAGKGISYQNQAAKSGSIATVLIGAEHMESVDVSSSGPEAKAKIEGFTKLMSAKLLAAHYPATADPAKMNQPMMLAILVVLVIYGTMVFGPLAAQLAELFPTKIRYSAVSLPYHVGNGWFGGLLPTTAFAIVAATGDIYSGLWYPITIAAMTLVVGLLFIPETYKREILINSEQLR
jgi:MFS-type transporter involved in bile tolerance (Atg22 family)